MRKFRSYAEDYGGTAEVEIRGFFYFVSAQGQKGGKRGMCFEDRGTSNLLSVRVLQASYIGQCLRIVGVDREELPIEAEGESGVT